MNSQQQKGSNKPKLDYGIAALIIMILIALFSFAQEWDRQATEEDHAISIQLALAQERGIAEREWSAKVARAYSQGQRDAMVVLSQRDGMSIAQTCQAWLHRDDQDEPASAVAAGRSSRTGG